MLPSQCFGAQRARRSRNIIATDQRLLELKDWLADFTRPDDLRPASEDASFRRYFRLGEGAGSLIAMDAPPPAEDCRPFVQVASYLEQMALNAPRVLQSDLERGFLLLTDLGTEQYLDRLPDDRDALYASAVDALVVMVERGEAFREALPPYDTKLLAFEMSLFHDWLCERFLGLDFSEEEEAAWQRTVSVLVASALEQPRVFVHRDYHSRNLMVTGHETPGILDFQDAMNGPLTYDLVSLLKDCYVKWPESFVEAHARRFYEAQSNLRSDWSEFRRWFDLMGVQRHLKAAGIFARLNLRDGKPGYIRDIPRTLSYVTELASDYDELAFIADFISRRVLPALDAAASTSGASA